MITLCFKLTYPPYALPEASARERIWSDSEFKRFLFVNYDIIMMLITGIALR